MRTLLIDIETYPAQARVWGLFNQNISLNQIVSSGTTACFAARWLDDPEGEFTFRSEWEHGFDEMVRCARELLCEADAIISYNGDKFDLPTLNREIIEADIGPPSPYEKLDLYRTVKKVFRFQSNKLDWVCQRLGLGAKTQHKGMDLWTGCQNGNVEDQEIMRTYNIQDVFLLEVLYRRLRPWITSHPNVALHDHIDTDEEPTVRCPKCGSTNVHHRGYRFTQTMKYRRLHCQDCGSWSRSRSNDLTAPQRSVILTTQGMV